jgi:hypothetical protein
MRLFCLWFLHLFLVSLPQVGCSATNEYDSRTFDKMSLNQIEVLTSQDEINLSYESIELMKDKLDSLSLKMGELRKRKLVSSYPYSCNTLASEGVTESGVYTVYPTGPLGTSYNVYCDLVTDGGGWMLTWAYNHVGGQNVALVAGTIPTNPKTGYSHVNVQNLYSSTDEISETRFYCYNGNNNRVMHFKTSNAFQQTVALTGVSTGNTAAYWNTGYTLLVNHTAFLPAATNGVYTSTTVGFSQFPFFKSTTYHWGIQGNGNRFECDDYSNGYAYSTLHNVYVRMVEGRPTTSPTVHPTPETPVPSQVPTPLPSPYPTVPPSFVPTPSPTPLPTPYPTMLPTTTHSPTPLPTPNPSLLPTPLPTLVPTSLPTPLPTPLPTSIPTKIPTPLPTLVPTVTCASGTYYNGLVCINCAIGKYSQNNDTAPWVATCKLCPAGKYNTQAGLGYCTDCDTGKLSSADRTYCKDCQPGEYNYNNQECIKCEYGKYAPSALTGACITCSAGFYTNNKTASISCISCSAGYYSSGGTDICLICPKGNNGVQTQTYILTFFSLFYTDI